MKKITTGLIFTAGLMLTTAFAAPNAIWAANNGAPDKPITMGEKKPARFDHQTHLNLGVNCGVCHHDEKHQPRAKADIEAMKDSSQLQCSSCHNKNFSNPDLQSAKQIFHARCRDCHKLGVDGKKGPTKCNSCHISSAPAKAIEGC